jgi:hypothetical protein
MFSKVGPSTCMMRRIHADDRNVIIWNHIFKERNQIVETIAKYSAFIFRLDILLLVQFLINVVVQNIYGYICL